MSLAVAIPTAGHAVIYKRDPRSATLWVLLIALLPLGGSLLYGLFGINRYQRRGAAALPRGRSCCSAGPLAYDAPGRIAAVCRSGHLVGRATGQSLTGGNRIEPLVDGEQATRPCSPPSIGAAQRRLGLVHLRQPRHRGAVRRCAAPGHERGVQVRVLIDDVYARWRPPAPTAPWGNAPKRWRRRSTDVDSRAPACRASAQSPQTAGDRWRDRFLAD